MRFGWLKILFFAVRRLSMKSRHDLRSRRKNSNHLVRKKVL
jgi:hypothetical protein